MSDVQLLLDTLRTNFSWQSAFDILLVALGIYYLLMLVKGTRAIQLLKGVAVVLALILVTKALRLSTVHWLLSNALLTGVIALIILFQPELRMALERLGRGRFWNPASLLVKQEEVERLVDEIVKACRMCSKRRTGGLVVLERGVGLGDVAQSGHPVDARASAELLATIFHPGSPLHDGAVLIRGDRVAAAACLLPLTDRDDVGVLLGTRHRAAIGLSEGTDAAVVVVSEETGTVSLTYEGKLHTNLSDDKLKAKLMEIFQPPKESYTGWLRKRAHARKPEL